jgi:hypothetical protein
VYVYLANRNDKSEEFYGSRGGGEKFESNFESYKVIILGHVKHLGPGHVANIKWILKTKFSMS